MIYAPNGVRKTSLANVLRYVSGQSEEKPQDRLHPDNVVTHDVLADGVAMEAVLPGGERDSYGV